MIKNKGAMILNCFSKFSRKFQNMIDGQASYQTGLMKLSGGARLNYVFHNWFGNTLFSFDPLDGLSDTEIRTAIKNSTGTKSSLFVSEGAFEVLARIQIKKLLRPSLTCVEQVYDELKRLVEQCSLPELNRYSNLKNNMISVVNHVLEECLGPTNRAVIDLINMELAYINTNHPDFIGGASALTSIFEKEKAFLTEGLTRNNSNDRSNKQVQDSIIQDSDSVPMTPSGKSRIILNDFFNDQHESRKSQYISTEYNETENISTYQNYKIIETHQISSISKPIKNIDEKSPVFPTNRSTTSSIDIFSPVQKIQGHNPAKIVHAGIFGANLPENEKNYSGRFGGKMGLPLVPETIETSGDPSEREKIESDVIKFFIVSYFNIVRKNVADSVPKAIMYFMVNAAKEAIQRELVAKLYREEIFDDLLQEEKGIVEKRQQCHRNINKLSNITKQLETLISNFNL
ncbi:dynamin-related protein [Cryptosporidium hominis TU502]|nr:dynamin-related protein [Cryptosporidium hominis TU502]